MSQDIVNKNQDISYTNLDFSSIYTELVDLAKQLSYRWDPSVSDESDPGVVLLKLSSLIADKMNYNIDKSVLETFPLSVTQDGNARQLYEQLGYYMNWYESAIVPVNFTWVGDKLSSEVVYTIPKFTILTDSESSLSYTLIGTISNNNLVVSDCKLPADGTTIQMIAMEGTPTTYSFLGETKITSQMIDENNRLYFETKYISQNGIFVRNSGNDQDNYLDWKRVDNLYEQPYNGLRYKFGIDSSSDVAYLEFPDNYAELIGSGIEIVYLIIDPEFANIPSKTLDRFLVNVVPVEDTQITLSIDNTKIENTTSASGHKGAESINAAYTNYKRTVGTFKTLITLRDYLNYILLEGGELCSNGFVTDRSNDPQLSYKVMSKVNGIDSLVTEVESDDIYETATVSSRDFANDIYYTYNINTQTGGWRHCALTDDFDPNTQYFTRNTASVSSPYYQSVTQLTEFEDGVTYYTFSHAGYEDFIQCTESSVYDSHEHYFLVLNQAYESVIIDETEFDTEKVKTTPKYFTYDVNTNTFNRINSESVFDDSGNTVYFEQQNIYRSTSVSEADFNSDKTSYYTLSYADNPSFIAVSAEDAFDEHTVYFIKDTKDAYNTADIDETIFNANKTKYYTHNVPNHRFTAAVTYDPTERYFIRKDSEKMTPFSLKFYLLQDVISANSKANFDQTFEMISSDDLPSLDALIADTAHIEHTYEDILPLGENTYKPSEDTTRHTNKSYYSYNELGNVYEFVSDSYYTLTEDTEVVEGKNYYKYNAQYDYYYKVDVTNLVTNPEENGSPAENGLYELVLLNTLDTVNPLELGWYEIDVEALSPHIAFFRAKYPLNMTITTYSVVGVDVQSDIKMNILNAFYENLNSSQLEFGAKIELDYLTEIVMAADSRIKSVVFDNISYSIEAIYYDTYKKMFVGRILPTEIELPVYSDENEVICYEVCKDIFAKSILAGTTTLLDQDTDFKYHLNQFHLYDNPSDVGIYSITSEAVIDMNNIATSVTTDNNLAKNYTLKENEVLNLYRPKLINLNSYETGVHYEYLTFADIAPNQSYKLSKYEYMIFYTTQLDANKNVVGYNGKVYTNGAIIKPSFYLKSQPTQEGLSEYFRTQWQDTILQQDESVYTCDTTSIYWTSIIQNSSSITNNLIQGSNSIIIQEMNTVTITPEDGYKFYWYLNKEQKAETTGKKFYELFGDFDSDSSTDKRNNGMINTYTLKSGESLYYVDKDFKNLATLHEGTTITRNCGINSDYTEIDSINLLNFVDYTELPDDTTFITNSADKIIPVENGFYEEKNFFKATEYTNTIDDFTFYSSDSDGNYTKNTQQYSGDTYCNISTTLFTGTEPTEGTNYYNLIDDDYMLNDTINRVYLSITGTNITTYAASSSLPASLSSQAVYLKCDSDDSCLKLSEDTYYPYEYLKTHFMYVDQYGDTANATAVNFVEATSSDTSVTIYVKETNVEDTLFPGRIFPEAYVNHGTGYDSSYSGTQYKISGSTSELTLGATVSSNPYYFPYSSGYAYIGTVGTDLTVAVVSDNISESSNMLVNGTETFDGLFKITVPEVGYNALTVVPNEDKDEYVYYTLTSYEFGGTDYHFFEQSGTSPDYKYYPTASTSPQPGIDYYVITKLTAETAGVTYLDFHLGVSPGTYYYEVTDQSSVDFTKQVSRDTELNQEKSYYVLQMNSTSGLYENRNGIYSPCGTTTYDIFEQIILDDDSIDSINPSEDNFYERVNYEGYVIEDAYNAKFIGGGGAEDVSIARPRYALSLDSTVLDSSVFKQVMDKFDVNNVALYPTQLTIDSSNASLYSPLVNNLFKVTDDTVEKYVFYTESDGIYSQVPPENITTDTIPCQEENWYELGADGEYYLTNKMFAYAPITAERCTATSPFEEVEVSSITPVNDFYYKFSYSGDTYYKSITNSPYLSIGASNDGIPNKLYIACGRIKTSQPIGNITLSDVDSQWNSYYSETPPSDYSVVNFTDQNVGESDVKYYFVMQEDLEAVNSGTILSSMGTSSIYCGTYTNNSITYAGYYVSANLYMAIEGVDVLPTPYKIDGYTDITEQSLNAWYAAVSKIGTSNISSVPLFVIPIFYKFLYVVSLKENSYYRLKTYADSSFGEIQPWQCDSLDSDYIVDNPMLALNNLWQPVQNNCSITITENEVFPLAEGDTISITSENISSQTNLLKWPVFSNTEIILNLDNYNVSYTQSNNNVTTLDSINIEGATWRAYSNLLLNTSSSSGQTVATNHHIAFLDENGMVIYDIPTNVPTDIMSSKQIIFQLKSPVDNKTGSVVEVVTYDDLGNEIPNGVCVFYKLFDTDYVSYLSTYDTTLKFKNEGSLNVELEFGLPVGEYLIPITTAKNVIISGELEKTIEYETPSTTSTVITDFASGDTQFTGDRTYYLYVNIPYTQIDGGDGDMVDVTYKLKFTSNSEANITLNDVFKFERNNTLVEASVFNEIFDKVKALDKDMIYNYTFQPTANDLIANPLSPKEFWNKNHVYNANVIPQLDLSSADNLNYRFITSR